MERINKGSLNITRQFFGIEGKEDSQLETQCVCVLLLHTVRLPQWFVVYLNCEMRSHVDIEEKKQFSASQYIPHLQLTVLYGFFFLRIRQILNLVRCIRSCLQHSKDPHKTTPLYASFVSLLQLHLCPIFKFHYAQILSFSSHLLFLYFEKFSFQDVPVFSLYNILDISLDKFHFFSPILKLVTSLILRCVIPVVLGQ